MYSNEVKERSKKLEVWLQGRPREVGLAVAVRSSMRALPVFWNWADSSTQAKEWQVSALLPLWANLSAWLVAVRSSEKNVALAETASQHCSDVAAHLSKKADGLDDFGADSAANAASFAALHAGEAYAPDPDKVPRLSVLYASCCLGSGHRKSNVQFLDAALRDCALIDSGKSIIYEPLWIGERNVVLNDWKELSARRGPKLSLVGKLFGSKKATSANIWWYWYQCTLDGRGQEINLADLEALNSQTGQHFPLMYVIPKPTKVNSATLLEV